MKPYLKKFLDIFQEIWIKGVLDDGTTKPPTYVIPKDLFGDSDDCILEYLENFGIYFYMSNCKLYITPDQFREDKKFHKDLLWLINYLYKIRTRNRIPITRIDTLPPKPSGGLKKYLSKPRVPKKL